MSMMQMAHRDEDSNLTKSTIILAKTIIGAGQILLLDTRPALLSLYVLLWAELDLIIE